MLFHLHVLSSPAGIAVALVLMKDLGAAFTNPVNGLAAGRTAPAHVHDILHACFCDLVLHYLPPITVSSLPNGIACPNLV